MLARKNRQGSNNEKTNCKIRIRRWPHPIYMTQLFHQPRQNAILVLLFTAIQHGLPRLHDTTQTTKKLTITAWTRAKIHPNTEPNELMESTQKTSCDRLFRSEHLQFHFDGKPPSEGTTSYDPKIYVHSKWTPPHWTIPPIALEERLLRFCTALNKFLQDTQKQNKSLASSTPSITNDTTTTNVPNRPMR